MFKQYILHLDALVCINKISQIIVTRSKSEPYWKKKNQKKSVGYSSVLYVVVCKSVHEATIWQLMTLTSDTSWRQRQTRTNTDTVPEELSHTWHQSRGNSSPTQPLNWEDFFCVPSFYFLFFTQLELTDVKEKSSDIISLTVWQYLNDVPLIGWCS